MKQVRITEKFCDIELFTWGSWDLIDTDMFYFYEVEFCMESMKKYNGGNVMRKLDGTMEVYSKDGSTVLWTGTLLDIPEIIKSTVRSNITDQRFVEYLKKSFSRKIDICQQ